MRLQVQHIAGALDSASGKYSVISVGVMVCGKLHGDSSNVQVVATRTEGEELSFQDVDMCF